MTMTSELGKTVATAIILGTAVVAINATDVQAAATPPAPGPGPPRRRCSSGSHDELASHVRPGPIG